MRQNRFLLEELLHVANYAGRFWHIKLACQAGGRVVWSKFDRLPALYHPPPLQVVNNPLHDLNPRQGLPTKQSQHHNIEEDVRVAGPVGSLLHEWRQRR